MKKILVLPIIAVLITVLSFSIHDASAQTSSAPCTFASLTDCGDLNYHHGSILHYAKNFVIFWEPSGINPDTGKPYTYDDPTIDSTATNPSDGTYENLITSYFKDVCGSQFYKMLDQYTGNYQVSGSGSTGPCSYGDFVIDPSPYPSGRGTLSNPLLEDDIKQEVRKFICHNCKTARWDIGEGQHDFFVYLPSNVQACSDVQIAIAFYTGCSSPKVTPPPGMGVNNVWCGFHDAFGTGTFGTETAGGVPVPFAVITDPNCTVPSSPNNDMLADEAIATTAHEQFESVTDPYPGITYPDGWYRSATFAEGVAHDHELGDECGTLNLIASLNGDPYIVQAEWDDATHTCDIGGNPAPLPPPPPPPTPSVRVDCQAHLDVVVGSSGSIPCTITPNYGFSSSVSLYMSEPDGYYFGLSYQLDKQTVTLTPTKTASVNLTVNPSSTGQYYVTLDGSYNSGNNNSVAISNTIEINVIPAMAISCPTHLDVVAVSSGFITCTITPQNGFSGLVSLQVAEPSFHSGLSYQLDKQTVTLTPTKTASVNLTVNPSSTGQYYVTLDGSYNSGNNNSVAISNTIEINVIPPTLSVSHDVPYPPSLCFSPAGTTITYHYTVDMGGNIIRGEYTKWVPEDPHITLEFRQNFDSMVNWSVTPPSGITITPSQGSLNLPANHVQYVVTTISFDHSLSSGKYDIPLRASDSILTESGGIDLQYYGVDSARGIIVEPPTKMESAGRDLQYYFTLNCTASMSGGEDTVNSPPSPIYSKATMAKQISMKSVMPKSVHLTPLPPSPLVPSWVKKTGDWWSKGQVSDVEFVKTIQYLADKKMITIPQTATGTITQTTMQIPSWVKTNAGLWANGKVSNQEFVSSIQYLVNTGVIKFGTK